MNSIPSVCSVAILRYCLSGNSIVSFIMNSLDSKSILYWTNVIMLKIMKTIDSDTVHIKQTLILLIFTLYSYEVYNENTDGHALL